MTREKKNDIQVLLNDIDANEAKNTTFGHLKKMTFQQNVEKTGNDSSLFFSRKLTDVKYCT